MGREVYLLYGQSEEKLGEAYFHHRVLKEFSFDIRKTDWPEEMIMYIKEYKLIQQEDTLKRKLLCTSKYSFYYDEDEDFSGKLWFKLTDAGGEEIFNTVYTRRDSENQPYWDIGYVLNVSQIKIMISTFLKLLVIIFLRSTTCLKKLREI